MKKSKKSIMFGLLISFALLFSNHNYHSLNNKTNNNTPLYKVVEKENIPTSRLFVKVNSAYKGLRSL